MRTKKFYRRVFAVASGYDLFLGFAFFLFYKSLYDIFKIQLPDNPAYLQLATAFVFVQGVSYFFVFDNLKRNIDIVKVGVLYKAIYASVAFYYWGIGGLPHPVFALFGFFDLIFIVFFLLYLKDYNRVIK